ncbi:MAG TPA: hypothetical protein PKJ79_07525, partial [Quisquiliibacterium sp.]|nr:hypothetical protein [Quisquiliibacterium sp.]
IGDVADEESEIQRAREDDEEAEDDFLEIHGGIRGAGPGRSAACGCVVRRFGVAMRRVAMRIRAQPPDGGAPTPVTPDLTVATAPP